MLYVNPLTTQYPTPGSELERGAARKEMALQEFEHFFLYQLLQDMRKTIPEGGLWDNSGEKAQFESMLDDHLAGEIAKSGQFGIARQMAQQLDRAQGVTQTTFDAQA